MKPIRDSFLSFLRRSSPNLYFALNDELASPLRLVLRSDFLSLDIFFCTVFRIESRSAGDVGVGMLDGNLVDYRSNTYSGDCDIAIDIDAVAWNIEN